MRSLPFNRQETKLLLDDLKATRNEAMHRQKTARAEHERDAMRGRRRRLGELRQWIFDLYNAEYHPDALTPQPRR